MLVSPCPPYERLLYESLYCKTNKHLNIELLNSRPLWSLPYTHLYTLYCRLINEKLVLGETKENNFSSK